MIKHKNVLVGSVLIVFATSVIGCGEGLRSSGASNDKVGPNSATNSTEDISKEIQKAEKANQEAQAAIDEALGALSSIQDENGNIKVSLFQKSTAEVNTTGLLTPIIDKLRVAFDTVFAKVALVKSKFDEARQLLLNCFGELDQNDPAQAAFDRRSYEAACSDRPDGSPVPHQHGDAWR
ncbi:MAG: hypothetical protein HC883_05550 [Bdellovibrionaceae bacterium]|nr:hypothetical protein [Pseudobdellovibrionaceae bacterium]